MGPTTAGIIVCTDGVEQAIRNPIQSTYNHRLDFPINLSKLLRA